MKLIETYTSAFPASTQPQFHFLSWFFLDSWLKYKEVNFLARGVLEPSSELWRMVLDIFYKISKIVRTLWLAKRHNIKIFSLCFVLFDCLLIVCFFFLSSLFFCTGFFFFFFFNRERLRKAYVYVGPNRYRKTLVFTPVSHRGDRARILGVGNKKGCFLITVPGRITCPYAWQQV